MLIKIVA